MPNALQSNIGTPPPPDIQGQPAQQPVGPGQGPPQQQQQPAPTHAQTVAALRHFHAIGQQLEAALKDPDVGKTDMKSKMIDGMTKLVADRMMKPAEAVTIMATFPERPFEQKQWLAQHMMTIVQARKAVLSHHGTAFAGGGPEPAPNPDNHSDDISSMMGAHYNGGRRG